MQTWAACLLSAATLAVHADAGNDSPSRPATVSTLITTPLVIEGLTNDDDGNLYAPGRALAATDPCPVYKVNIANPTLVIVGLIPRARRHARRAASPSAPTASSM
jgi:hypothetical protein